MKLRLIESSKPISKLEKNIKRNVLPVLEDKGVDFYKVTNNPTSYKTIYTGTLGNTNIKFILYSSYPILDAWNDDNNDDRDLFGVLYLNGHLFELGPISSKDPSTVEESLADLDFEDYRTYSQEEMRNKNLIEPLSNVGNYKPMTKEEWIKLYHDLAAEVEEAKQKMHEKYSDDEFEEQLKHPSELPEDDPLVVWKNKSDFFHRVFVPKIYPLTVYDE